MRRVGIEPEGIDRCGSAISTTFSHSCLLQDRKDVEAGLSERNAQGPGRTSWQEANLLAGQHVVEPGDVTAIAEGTDVQLVLVRTIWYPRDDTFAACSFPVLVAVHLSALMSNIILMRVYAQTSIFTSIGGIVVFSSWFLGKSLVVSDIRSEGSACLKPFALARAAGDERLADVRAKGFMQLYRNWACMRPCIGICSLMGAAMLLVGGWAFSDLPLWAWIVLAAAFLIAFVVDSSCSIPGAVTDIFLRSCDAAIVCLNDLDVFTHIEMDNGARMVDWKETYRNYDMMCQFVDEFCRSWRTYFFVVEFVAVPAAGLCLLGLIQDVNAVRRAAGVGGHDPAPGNVPILLRAASVVFGCFYLLLCVMVVTSLWIRASRVTAACDIARQQGLAAISEAAGLQEFPIEPHGPRPGPDSTDLHAKGTLAHSSSPRPYKHLDMDVERERARGFVAYAELRSPGFSCHGVAISFHLGTVLIYPIITVVCTLFFPLASVVV